MAVPAYIGRIKWKNTPIGTGFFVAPDWVATCYHVLRDAVESPVGQLFNFETLMGNIDCQLILIEDKYSVEKDVALLRIIGAAPNIVPGRLVRSSLAKSGSQFHTVGHGKLDDKHDYEYHPATGSITGVVSRDSVQMIQLDSKQVLRGMSGGPVIVDELGGIVGLVSARYTINPNNDLWMRDTVWVATTESLAELAPDEINLSSPRPLTINLPSEVGRLKIFLSSTSRDLSEYREMFIDQCRLRGYGVIAMEEFGAQDADAVDVSLKEIEPCDLFVGVYAKRYGYVPDGHAQSITEMEYHEAVRLQKPRLIFVVDHDQPLHELINWHRDDKGEKAKKLHQFLAVVGKERVWDRFTSPEDFTRRALMAVSNWQGWITPHFPSSSNHYIARPELDEQVVQTIESFGRIGISGIGGIGKSMVLANYTANHHKQFPAGVFWVRLGSEATNPTQILKQTIRLVADCHPVGRLIADDDLQVAQVKHWLDERKDKLLFVFDDIWSIQVVRRLLQLIPESVSMVFSSRRIDILRQLALTNQQILQIDGMGMQTAIAMLRDRVGQVPSLSALREIAELLQGHPLSIEIIAAQIVNQGADFAESLPTVIREKMQTEIGLGLLEAEVQGEFNAIEAVFSLSYDNLSEDLKRRFRAIGLMAFDSLLFPRITAAIWYDDLGTEQGKAEVLDRLDALSNLGLLSEVKHHESYSIHRMVNVYARSLLVTFPEEMQNTRIRYANELIEWAAEHLYKQTISEGYFNDYLEHLFHVIIEIYKVIHQIVATAFKSSDSSSDIMATISAPDTRINGSVQWSDIVNEHFHIANILMEVAKNYVAEHRETGNIGIYLFRLGLVTARLTEYSDELQRISDFAQYYANRELLDDGENYARVLLSRSQQVNDKTHETTALHVLSMLMQLQGKSDQALAFAEMEVEIKREGQLGWEAVHTMISYGALLQQTRRYNEAFSVFQELLTYAPSELKPNDMTLLSSLYNEIGWNRRALGFNEEAISAFNNALDLARQVHNIEVQAVILQNLGDLYRLQEDYDKAIQYLSEALPLRRKVNSLQGEAKTLYSLGMATAKSSPDQINNEFLNEAIKVAEQTSNPGLLAGTMRTRAVTILGEEELREEGTRLLIDAYEIMQVHDLRTDAFGVDRSEYRDLLQLYRIEIDEDDASFTPSLQPLIGFFLVASWDDFALHLRESEESIFVTNAYLSILIENTPDKSKIEPRIQFLHKVIQWCMEDGIDAGIKRGRAEQPDYPVDPGIEGIRLTLSVNQTLQSASIYHDRGLLDRALELYKEAFDLVSGSDLLSLKIDVLLMMAKTEQQRGYPERALTYYDLALPIATEVNDESILYKVYNSIGAAFNEIGRFDDAMKNLKIALQIRERMGEPIPLAITHGNLAAVFRNYADFQQALYHAEMSVEYAPENTKEKISSCLNLALLQMKNQMYSEAEIAFEEALDHVRVQNIPDYYIAVQANYGVFLSNQERYPEAIEKLNAALHYCEVYGLERTRLGVTRDYILDAIRRTQKAMNTSDETLKSHNEGLDEGERFFQIATNYGNRGQLENASNLINQAVEVWEKAGRTDKIFHAYSYLIAQFHVYGRHSEALEFIDRPVELAHSINDPEKIAIALLNKGVILSGVSQIQSAIEVLRLAAEGFKELSLRSYQVAALSSLGVQYRKASQEEKALEIYSEALEVAQLDNDVSNSASLLNNIGVVYSSLDQPETAVDYFQRSIPLYQQIGQPADYANALANIGWELYKGLNRGDEALNYIQQAIEILSNVVDRPN